MTRKVIVLGAGPGGLASAMLLARAGADVTVLERNNCVGGRTSTFALGDFRFDLGPTFFLYPRILTEIYAAVGERFADHVVLTRLDPQYRLVFGDGTDLLASPTVETMVREIAKLNEADAKNLRRFLAENRDKFARFAPVLQRPFLGWSDLFTRAALRLLPVLRPWNGLDRELKRYFRDPRVRLAFTFQGKYLGMSPFRCPSVFSILSFLEYEHGVFHPTGGCGAVSDSMARVATKLGAKVRLGEEVRGLRFEGRRVTGVETTVGSYDCDALIINADFARTMTKLVPDHLRRRWTDAKIKKKKFSCSTFMLYLGVEGTFPDVAHHTIYLPQDYVGVIADIEGHRLSADPAIYVQNAGVTDSTLAPRGCSSLYVLVPVTHQTPNVDWTRERDRFRSLVLKQLTRVGLPDLTDRIRCERVVTPDDWDQGYEIHRGATFNLAHTIDQMLHLRPRNRFEDLGGVYLTGGGTHPGSGLPVIYESARITTRLLLDEWGEPSDWLTP